MFPKWQPLRPEVEGAGNGAADWAGGPGHQRSLSGKLEHAVPALPTSNNSAAHGSEPGEVVGRADGGRSCSLSAIRLIKPVSTLPAPIS